ncbi:Ubiquitin fusion degradation protein 1 [Tetrabaena socialis]|uniref:Ubiquitin fusion degradation protein 1 n=1 Tax=Tetrabaena socialis TaxID=47790 RepID=A0A2J8A836_9CHLO|nr:Ubiquitin fusion degradation protein 1 [Tetrabaena socialis]|eukprot:PNH08702.1 Ubiquitin fusion degradation protein 1 [Tetrabaena socialis]
MFGGFGPGGYGPGMPGFGSQTFEALYRAMPLAFIDKQTAEHGDKIIMPPSALERLATLHIEYPMLFKLEGVQSKRQTHCGVLEFIAEEGVVYMPHWMMQNLLLQVGDTIRVRSVSLPKGTYVKLQPVTSDFLDITNPKAVLERTLRNYTCLTVGDCFVVNYNNKNYEIEVKDAKPGPAISVIETDCQVDFEAPKDYKEPERMPPKAQEAGPAAAVASTSAEAKGGPAAAAATGATPEPEAEDPTFLAFAGTGRRLDGKAAGPSNPVPVPLRVPSINASSGASPSGSAPGTSGPPATGPAASGPSGSGGQKAGTFVNFGPTGNRLEAKLAAKQGGGAPKPPPPPPEEPKPEDKTNFKAFGGKGYRMDCACAQAFLADLERTASTLGDPASRSAMVAFWSEQGLSDSVSESLALRLEQSGQQYSIKQLWGKVQRLQRLLPDADMARLVEKDPAVLDADPSLAIRNMITLVEAFPGREMATLMQRQPKLLYCTDLPERKERVLGMLTRLHPSGELSVVAPVVGDNPDLLFRMDYYQDVRMLDELPIEIQNMFVLHGGGISFLHRYYNRQRNAAASGGYGGYGTSSASEEDTSD